MGRLEARFFSCKRETIITSGHPDAKVVVDVLKKGLRKGNYILRCGRSTMYNFCFDRIYG